jgi:hypothetical protein
MGEVTRLSRLTPAVVDRIFGTTVANPPEGRSPVFIWMVGAPGAGKSSGHSYLTESDPPLLTSGNYATINVDTLLESLLPFRVGSAMGYTVSKVFPEIKFSSISAYQSKKENVGAFKWYDEARGDLEGKADPDMLAALNAARVPFLHLKDKEKTRSLLSKNDAAIGRAIDKGIDIVYETTLSVGSGGRITKVDELMPLLAEKGYTIKVVHVTAPPKNIAARVTARQEYGMPYEEHPYYRMVPTFLTAKLVAGTAEGVATIESQYPGVEIIHIENPSNPALMVAPREFVAANLIGRIHAAYPAREASSEGRTSSELASARKPAAAKKRTTAKKNTGANGAGGGVKKAASPPKEAGGAVGPEKPKTKRTYTRRAAGGKKKSSSSSSSD